VLWDLGGSERGRHCVDTGHRYVDFLDWTHVLQPGEPALAQVMGGGSYGGQSSCSQQDKVKSVSHTSQWRKQDVGSSYVWTQSPV
jgi:hypothetical protein